MNGTGGNLDGVIVTEGPCQDSCLVSRSIEGEGERNESGLVSQPYC